MTLLILFTSLLVLLIAICEDLRWFYRQNSGLDSTLWILTKTNHYQQQNCKTNCSNLGVSQLYSVIILYQLHCKNLTRCLNLRQTMLNCSNISILLPYSPYQAVTSKNLHLQYFLLPPKIAWNVESSMGGRFAQPI